MKLAYLHHVQQKALNNLLFLYFAFTAAYIRCLNLLEKLDLYVRLVRMPGVRWFNKLSFLLSKNTLEQTHFMGKHVLKFPSDLWTYQEIIFECKPDVIVESGIFLGGSTSYLASLCQTMGHGRVIGIDITLDHVYPDIADLPNVTLLEGSSLDTATVERVRALIQPGEQVMVILDSDHHGEHVYQEMHLFAPLVSEGQYMVVEDGIIDQVFPLFRNRGPLWAVRRFLQDTQEFVVDHSRTRHLLTHNPCGYLLRMPAQQPVAAPYPRPEDLLRPVRLMVEGLPRLQFFRFLGLPPRPEELTRWLPRRYQNKRERRDP